MKISKEIIEVLDYIGSKVGITIDWAAENVIPQVEKLCKKFITWEVSTSIAWIVIILLAAIVIIIIDNTLLFSEGFITTIAVVIAVIVIGVQTFDIIKCKTFPEKAIYDYIMNNTDILDD